MVLSACSYSSIAFYPPGATFGPRALFDYEFVWMIEGDAEYICRKGNQQREIGLPQGSLLLCQPICIDQFIWDKTHNTRHAFFHFSIEKKESFLLKSTGWPMVRPVVDGNLLDTLFRHLINWSSEGSTEQRYLLSSALLTAFLTGETQVHAISPTQLPEPVQRAMAFMTDHVERDPSAKLDLKTIASAACVSPEYLCRRFKTSTKYSPLETLRLMRLERAAVLLERSNYSVTQVAQMTGFESPFHFSRVFKSVYGMSPREAQRLAATGKHLPHSPLRRL